MDNAAEMLQQHKRNLDRAKRMGDSARTPGQRQAAAEAGMDAERSASKWPTLGAELKHTEKGQHLNDDFRAHDEDKD